MCELDSLACGYPLSQHHLLKDRSFTIGVSWCPCRKSTDHTCMGLFLDIQFFSIGLGIHPNACTTLSWLIPNLQQHWKSKCDSDLFSLQKKLCVCVCVWLFWILSISIWILEAAYFFLQKTSLDFDRDCVEYIDQYGEYCRLSNIKFSNPWTQILIHLCLNFFKWCLNFLAYFLVYVLVFHLFDKGNSFLNLIFVLSIASV